MQLRWLLVLAIVSWFVYVWISPCWHDLWLNYKLHIKFGLAIVAIVVLLALPSVESLLAQKHPLVECIRAIVFREMAAPVDSIRSRIASGASLVREINQMTTAPTTPVLTANEIPPTGPTSVSSPGHVRGLPPHPLPRKHEVIDRRDLHAQDSLLSEALQNKIAASQQWRCARCNRPLASSYRI